VEAGSARRGDDQQVIRFDLLYGDDLAQRAPQDRVLTTSALLDQRPPLALGADVLAACGSTTSPTPGLVWIFSRCSFLPYQPCQAFFPSCAACSHPAPARKAAMRTTSAYSAPVRTFWRWISASRHAFCASFAERMAEGYAWVVNDCQLSRRIRGKAAAVNSSGVAVAAREVI
jgi:hypothetical protein